MTTLAEPRPAPFPVPEPGEAVLRRGVSWGEYLRVGDELRQRPGLRLTFDRGDFEIMTLSTEHEGLSALLRLLVQTLAMQVGLACRCFGSATMQREDLARGLEPDSCFWLRNLDRIRGLRRFDPAVHPPDLAIEVDVSHSSINRSAIYAALGVPELWRLRAGVLKFHVLDAAGAYAEVDRSPLFPMVASADLLAFVRRGEAEDESVMVREFLAWFQQRPSV